MVLKRFISIFMLISLLVLLSAAVMAEDTLVIREAVIFDLQTYGILRGGDDGDIALEKNVTRAEFSAFVVRLIGAVHLPYTAAFRDVTQDAWYAEEVSTLVGYGLINGNEQGEFRPNDSITHVEAMKILVCALGYKSRAEEAGGYPEGYQYMGSILKINKGVIAEPTDYLTRGAVVLMLYNALDIEMLESESYGTQDRRYQLKGNTLRGLFSSTNKAEPIFMSTGIVTADYYTFLLSPVASIKQNEVEINGTIYDAGETNTSELLGMEAEYYYSENDFGRPVIVNSRATSKNDSIIIEGKDIFGIDGDTLKYYDTAANKDIRAKLSASFQMVKNYQLVGNPYSLIEGSDICKNGFVKLIDNTGDGLYDLAVIEDYSSYRVSKVSNNGIFIANDKLYNGRRFIEIDQEDENVKLILKNAAGENMALDDIMENDVISVIQSEDKSVLKCIAGLKNVSGYLTEVYNREISIDGEMYSLDYYCQDEVRAGYKITAYLDFGGNVVEIETGEESGKNYAYILGGGAGNGLDATFELKVLLPGKLKQDFEVDDSEEDRITTTPVLKAYNSKVDIFPMSARVMIDGERKNKDEYSVMFSAVNLAAFPERRLVSYEVNSEGLIVNIEFGKRIGEGSFKIYNAYENVFGKEGTQPFGTSENTAVICIPSGGIEGFDDDNYYATVLLNNNQRYEITGYDIDPDNYIANVVAITAPMDINAGATINRNSKMAVLSNVSTVMTAEDDEVKIRLDFYSEGKKMTYMVAKDSVAEKLAANMEFGNVFYYALNNFDEVYRLSLCELGNLGIEHIPGDRGSNDTQRSILGRISDIQYNVIDILENRRVNRLTVVVDENLGRMASLDINRRNTPNVYMLDTKQKTVSVGSIDDIYIDKSLIFAHIEEYSVKGIVLVRQ